MNNKFVIVDTSKIKTEVVKQLTESKENFTKANYYISKIYELKCPEFTSILDFVKKDITENNKLCDDYISKMNKVIKSFNNLSTEIIKKSSTIEKINASSLMSRK